MVSELEILYSAPLAAGRGTVHGNRGGGKLVVGPIVNVEGPAGHCIDWMFGVGNPGGKSLQTNCVATTEQFQEKYQSARSSSAFQPVLSEQLLVDNK